MAPAVESIGGACGQGRPKCGALRDCRGVLLGGGAAYTVGAIVVGARWPDPWTDSFGYHEIWHVFVVIAASLHTAMAVSLAW